MVVQVAGVQATVEDEVRGDLSLACEASDAAEIEDASMDDVEPAAEDEAPVLDQLTMYCHASEPVSTAA